MPDNMKDKVLGVYQKLHGEIDAKQDKLTSE